MSRKFFFVFLLGLFVLSCASAPVQQSDVLRHDSMYKNWSHLWFSWAGYKSENCNKAVQMKSEQEGWWGETVPCPE
ncbi:MAG: hypothetical protein ACE14T_03440 [Syntrophales bacterium]